MLNRLSSGHRPILAKVKNVSSRGQSKIDTSSNLAESAQMIRSLQYKFSSSKLDPRSSNRVTKPQQKDEKLTFSPIVEPKSWKKKSRVPIVEENPVDWAVEAVKSAPWIAECSDIETLEGAIFRAQTINDLLDILGKNAFLMSENELALLLLVQRLSFKVSRIVSIEEGLQKPLTADNYAGVKWLLGKIPTLLENNLTPPTILSCTRLLSNLYLAIQYTDPLLQTVTKQVFTRVAELVRIGQYDQNPDLLLLLVKEFARIHYSPRNIVDKIAKYISNNEVSFLTTSIERHAVLSFFSAVEIMWRQRKHPVLDAGAIYLENKIADITNILCMVIAQHPKNKKPHFLNSTTRLEKMQLPTLNLVEAVKAFGVVARLQIVWGQRQMPRLVNKLLFVLVEYLNADPSSIASQLKELQEDGDSLNLEEDQIAFDMSKWTGFNWNSMVFPSTLEALSYFSNKIDPSVTIQVLRRAIQTLDQMVDSKIGHLVQHRILLSSLRVLTILADKQKNSAEVAELAEVLSKKVESVLSAVVLNKEHPVKIKSELLPEVCRALSHCNMEVQAQLATLADKHLGKVASSASRRFGVAAMVEIYSAGSHTEIWWPIFERVVLGVGNQQTGTVHAQISPPAELLDALTGHELALLSGLFARMPIAESSLVLDFANMVYSKIGKILSGTKIIEIRHLVFSLGTEGVKLENLPDDVKKFILDHFRSELKSPEEFLRNQYQLPLTFLALSRLVATDSKHHDELLKATTSYVGKLSSSEFSNLINKVADTIIQAFNRSELNSSGVGILTPSYLLMYQGILNVHKEKWQNIPGLIAYWMHTWTQLNLRQLLVFPESTLTPSLSVPNSSPLLLAILESLESLEVLASKPETQATFTKVAKILTPHVVKRFLKEFEEIDAGKDFPNLKSALMVRDKDASPESKQNPETMLELLELFESVMAASDSSSEHPTAVLFREKTLRQANIRKLLLKIKNELLEHKVTSTNTLTRLHSLLTFCWKHVPTVEQKELEKLKKTGTAFGLVKGFTPKDEAKNNPILTSVSREEMVEIMKLVDKMVG